MINNYFRIKFSLILFSVLFVVSSLNAALKVSTNSYYTKGAKTAFCGVKILSFGTTTSMKEFGVLVSKKPNQDSSDFHSFKKFKQNGLSYIIRIDSLTPNTKYYVKAYAKSNNNEVTYGDEIEIRTLRMGNLTYTVSRDTDPANKDAYDRIEAAVKTAVDYYNNYTTIVNKSIYVTLNSGVQTADATYAGSIRVGTNASYQKTGTILHEISHVMGAGQTGMWWNLMVNGQWQGSNATSVYQFMGGLLPSTSLISGDGMHFWPNGINGYWEDDGTDALYLTNVMIVQGMGEDGLPPSDQMQMPLKTFDPVTSQKYYIKNSSISNGRNTSFLVDNGKGLISQKSISTTNVILNDSAAWYVYYDDDSYLYRIQNVATKKFFHYKAANQLNGINLLDTTDVAKNYHFQFLKSSTYNLMIGDENASLYLPTYTLILPETAANQYQSLDMVNSINTESWNYSASKNSQNWLFFTEADLAKFDAALTSPYTSLFKLETDAIYQIKPDNATYPATGNKICSLSADSVSGKIYLRATNALDKTQQWKISLISGTTESTKHYTMRNVGTNKCLTIGKWLTVTGVDDEVTASQFVKVLPFDSLNLNQQLRIMYGASILDGSNIIKVFGIENNNTVQVNGVANTKIFRLDTWAKPYVGEQMDDYQQWTTLALSPAQRWLIQKIGITLGIDSPKSRLTSRVYSSNGKIVVEADNFKEIQIYSIVGKLVYRSICETQIPVLKGIYIVKVDADVHKIIVN